MQSDILTYLLVVGVMCTVGYYVWLLLSLLQSNEDDSDQESIVERIPAITEASIFMGLAPKLTVLALLSSCFGVFLFLQFLQGTKFASGVVFTLVFIFFLSATAIRNMNIANHLKLFETQLPEVIGQLIASMRGGRALARAFEDLPTALPEPAATEIFEIADRSKRGLGLDEALSAASQKYESRNFSLLIAILKLFVKQGGNVVEPLQKMSYAYKDIIRSDEKIRSASSGGRYIFFAINGAMLFIFSFVSISAPQLLQDIFVNIVGILAFIFGVSLYVLGAYWMWATMKVEV